MKRILYLCIIFWAASACSDSASEPAEITMEVRNYAEQKMYTFGYEQGIYLWSAKKWADKAESNVRYFVDPQLLEAYNQREGKNLKLLPESCYRIEKMDFVVTDDDQYARFKAMCSPEKILEIGGQVGKVEYALPISIEVNGQKIEERYGSAIIGIDVEKPYFSLKDEEVVMYDYLKDGEEQEIEVPYSINFENSGWINLNFTVNQRAVDEYNKMHGTDYNVFPAKNVSWDTDACILDKGKTEGMVPFLVKIADMKKGISLLPIELSGVSGGAMIDPEKSRKYYLFSPIIPQSNWNTGVCLTWKGSAAKLIDGQTSEDYNSSWVPAGEAPEFYVTYSLKDQTKTANVIGLRMYCFKNGGKGSREADVFVSMDSVSWGKAGHYNFVIENNAQKPLQNMIFDKMFSARYLKIMLNKSTVYDNYVGFSEVYVDGFINE